MSTDTSRGYVLNNIGNDPWFPTERTFFENVINKLPPKDASAILGQEHYHVRLDSGNGTKMIDTSGAQVIFPTMPNISVLGTSPSGVLQQATSLFPHGVTVNTLPAAADGTGWKNSPIAMSGTAIGINPATLFQMSNATPSASMALRVDAAGTGSSAVIECSAPSTGNGTLSCTGGGVTIAATCNPIIVSLGTTTPSNLAIVRGSATVMYLSAVGDATTVRVYGDMSATGNGIFDGSRLGLGSTNFTDNFYVYGSPSGGMVTGKIYNNDSHNFNGAKFSVANALGEIGMSAQRFGGSDVCKLGTFSDNDLNLVRDSNTIIGLGTSTVAITGTTTITGDATSTGNARIIGDAHINGDLKVDEDTSSTGNTHIGGNLVVDGRITEAGSDTTFISGVIPGSGVYLYNITLPAGYTKSNSVIAGATLGTPDSSTFYVLPYNGKNSVGFVEIVLYFHSSGPTHYLTIADPNGFPVSYDLGNHFYQVWLKKHI
jgi:hypothetical protein